MASKIFLKQYKYVNLKTKVKTNSLGGKVAITNIILA